MINFAVIPRGNHNYFIKSVIDTFLFSQILAKFEYGIKRVATTLTLWIYAIPKGNAICLVSVSACCLSCPIGNARSPTEKISRNAVLTLLSYINRSFGGLKNTKIILWLGLFCFARYYYVAVVPEAFQSPYYAVNKVWRFT